MEFLFKPGADGRPPLILWCAVLTIAFGLLSMIFSFFWLQGAAAFGNMGWTFLVAGILLGIEKFLELLAHKWKGPGA